MSICSMKRDMLPKSNNSAIIQNGRWLFLYLEMKCAIKASRFVFWRPLVEGVLNPDWYSCFRIVLLCSFHFGNSVLSAYLKAPCSWVKWKTNFVRKAISIRSMTSSNRKRSFLSNLYRAHIVSKDVPGINASNFFPGASVSSCLKGYQ